MSKIVESAERPVKQPKATKMCLKCGKVKDNNDFYNNRDWIDQLGKDIWCKDCVGKLTTKDEIREYFWRTIANGMSGYGKAQKAALRN